MCHMCHIVMCVTRVMLYNVVSRVSCCVMCHLCHVVSCVLFCVTLFHAILCHIVSHCFTCVSYCVTLFQMCHIVSHCSTCVILCHTVSHVCHIVSHCFRCVSYCVTLFQMCHFVSKCFRCVIMCHTVPNVSYCRAAKNSDFVRVIGFFYPPLQVRTDIYAINDLFGLWTRYKIGINLNYSDTSHFAHAHGTS